MMGMKKVVVVAGIIAAAVLLQFVVSNEEMKILKHKTSKAKEENGSLSFLVVGDWGRRGLYNQSLVSTQMGKIGEKMKIDFIISTGDNFYEDGLTGSDDPAFVESFSNIYTSPSLQVSWFSVLGNHDYRGNVEAQLSLALRQREKRWLCFRSFIVNAGVADFFFVDTTPFVDEYFIDPGNHTYDWRGVLPRDNYLSTLIKNLSSALKRSKATWKIVVGHHTIKSAGHHGVTLELATRLEPVLQKYNVDFYLNGHDHCLQHITSAQSNTQYITSGGGSKAWRGDVQKWSPEEELKFYYDGQGFLFVHVDPSIATFAFYDVFGNVLQQWDVSKPSFSEI